MTPKTYGELWDALQELFGFGGFDDSTANDPYWVYRRTGIGMLKKLMQRRRMSIAQVWMVAEFCAADRSMTVRSHYELLSYYVPAYRRAQVVAQERSDRLIGQRLQHALDVETDPVLRGRLMRASDDARERVLTEWESAHV